MNKISKAIEHVSFFVIIFVGFFALIQTTHAFSTVRSFGGKITNTKADEIERLENSNFKCSVPGSTITINPVNKNSPRTYVIPSNVRSETNNQLKRNQLILGLYSVGKTTVTCKYQGWPPRQETVTLDTLKLYGNSK